MLAIQQNNNKNNVWLPLNEPRIISAVSPSTDFEEKKINDLRALY